MVRCGPAATSMPRRSSHATRPMLARHRRVRGVTLIATLRPRRCAVLLRCVQPNTSVCRRSSCPTHPASLRSSHHIHVASFVACDSPSRTQSVATASLRFPAALADRPRSPVVAFATVLLTLVAICARIAPPSMTPTLAASCLGATAPRRASRRPISIGRQFGRDAPPIA
jgi:hypothetical protein